MRKIACFIVLFLLLAVPLEAKVLTEDHFRELFLREVGGKLPWKAEDLELLRFHAEPERVEVPDGAREVVRFRQPPKIGSNTLLVDYYQGETLVVRVRLMGYLEAMIPVVVLKRPLARHSLVRKEDLAVEKRPLSRLPKDVLSRMTEAVGLRTKVSLRAGQPLRSSNLEVPPVIKRGRLVRIVAEGPGFTVSAVGEARQDGRPGEIIRVRNLSSKREVFARVVDEKTVKVTF